MSRVRWRRPEQAVNASVADVETTWGPPEKCALCDEPSKWTLALLCNQHSYEYLMWWGLRKTFRGHVGLTWSAVKDLAQERFSEEEFVRERRWWFGVAEGAS